MLRAVPDGFAPMLASALIAAEASRQAAAAPTTARDTDGAEAPVLPATATASVPATAPAMGVAA
jgi:hypothetical protein